MSSEMPKSPYEVKNITRKIRYTSPEIIPLGHPRNPWPIARKIAPMKKAKAAPTANPATPRSAATSKLTTPSSAEPQKAPMAPKVPRMTAAERDQAEHERHLAQLLFAHGDVRNPMPETIRTLDSITSEYITSICFGAAQSAALHGRNKIKVDDVMYALRDNPEALGRIEEMQEKSKEISTARKAVQEDVTAKTMEDLAAEEEAKKGAKGKAKPVKKSKADGDDFGNAFKKNLKGAFS